jgi:hypothetical protein
LHVREEKQRPIDTTSIGEQVSHHPSIGLTEMLCPVQKEWPCIHIPLPFDERQAEELKELDLGVQDDRGAIQIII